MDRTAAQDEAVASEPGPRTGQPRPMVEHVLKAALAVPTLLLIVSFGGQMFLPVLVPAHVWAANRSGPTGRALWAVPSAIAAAMYAWLVVYSLLGESQPTIWLAPLLAAFAGSYAFRRITPAPTGERSAVRARLERRLANRSTRPAAAVALALALLSFLFIFSIGSFLVPLVWVLVGVVTLVEWARPTGSRDRVALTLAGVALACPWVPLALGALVVRATT